ncbi:hypothetical protein ACOME3_001851 [Neoechinorhynchus agilis]
MPNAMETAPKMRIEYLYAKMRTKVKCHEREEVLLITPTKFRAYAGIRFRRKYFERRSIGNRLWKCGWIQAVCKVSIRNFYGSFGCTTYEMAQGDVSDSDGFSLPWYSDEPGYVHERDLD